eukprot:5935125-Ditylum_brightwellii.AAC.1
MAPQSARGCQLRHSLHRRRLLPLTTRKNDVLHELTNIIPNYPTVRLLDFALQKDDGLFGIDITTTFVAPLAKIP